MVNHRRINRSSASSTRRVKRFPPALCAAQFLSLVPRSSPEEFHEPQPFRPYGLAWTHCGGEERGGKLGD